MTIEEIEAEALKLDPKSRARLANKLLGSLENLSPEENDKLWAIEAARRDAEMQDDPKSRRSAGDVFRDARSELE